MNKEEGGATVVSSQPASLVKKDDYSMLGNVRTHSPESSPPDTYAAALELSQKGLQLLVKGELKRYHQVAEFITKGLSEKFGGAWHTIVGKSYGSFVTHEDASLVYFSIGQVLVLTFKHG
mmetsp:Transcript_9757/g.17966  ORF Transcript_9757/g.17966 Transcript_9757/m.17966 type:complete len:120 (+) Transcript_9757:179-538(+)